MRRMSGKREAMQRGENSGGTGRSNSQAPRCGGDVARDGLITLWKKKGEEERGDSPLKNPHKGGEKEGESNVPSGDFLSQAEATNAGGGGEATRIDRRNTCAPAASPSEKSMHQPRMTG